MLWHCRVMQSCSRPGLYGELQNRMFTKTAWKQTHSVFTNVCMFTQTLIGTQGLQLLTMTKKELGRSQIDSQKADRNWVADCWQLQGATNDDWSVHCTAVHRPAAIIRDPVKSVQCSVHICNLYSKQKHVLKYKRLFLQITKDEIWTKEKAKNL